jgi:hypothetical protein
MDEELQEFILNMTPYPNGEGIQTRILDSQQPTGVTVPQLEPDVDQKI